MAHDVAAHLQPWEGFFKCRSAPANPCKTCCQFGPRDWQIKGFLLDRTQKKRKTTTMDDNKIGRTILRKNEWYIPSRYVLCVWYLGWGYAIYEFLHEYRVYLLITTQLHAFCILSLWKDESFITSFLTEFFGSFSVFSGIIRLLQQRQENANAMISYEVAFSWSSVMF